MHHSANFPRPLQSSPRVPVLPLRAALNPAHSLQMFLKIIGLLVFVAALAFPQTTEALHGSAGKDVRWNSGWIDFTQPINFSKGDQLRLSVGGAANKVVVRFLDDSRRADSPEGVIGVFPVGADRIVRITLDADYRGIQQISVHGGPNPWNLYDLGGGNGAATLSAAQILRANRK